MGACCSRCSDAHKSAFVKCSILRWILGDLRFKDALPRHDYIRRLVERFRESTSPESMRRVTFNPDQIMCEYISASCHLPGAYVDFFPCPYCTYKDDEEGTSFAEVYHFANVHNPNVCATVTFTMPVESQLLKEPVGCSIEVELMKGCPNTPMIVVHSPRVVLHISTDVFIEVVRFLQRSELEKMRQVSRRWTNIIGWAEGSLPQRRSFVMMPKIYGESPGMLSVHFVRQVRSGPWRILRVLTTRGLSHALNAVRSHLRTAFVDVLPFFLDRVPDPGQPGAILFDIPHSRRIEWLRSLLHSMPLNSEIRSWCVSDYTTGLDNLRTLAHCALQPHKKLGRVQTLELGLHNRDATWTRLASLLNQPRIRGFREITLSTTRAAIDASGLRAILSSLKSLKLRVMVSGGIEPQDALLTIPAQIIRDFLALRDVGSFAAEFWLHYAWELSDVDEPTDRRKRFRYYLQGEETVVRVSVYTNPTARERLTVATFDRFRGAVLFFKGNASVAELKQAICRIYDYY